MSPFLSILSVYFVLFFLSTTSPLRDMPLELSQFYILHRNWMKTCKSKQSKELTCLVVTLSAQSFYPHHLPSFFLFSYIFYSTRTYACKHNSYKIFTRFCLFAYILFRGRRIINLISRFPDENYNITWLLFAGIGMFRYIVYIPDKNIFLSVILCCILNCKSIKMNPAMKYLLSYATFELFDVIMKSIPWK